MRHGKSRVCSLFAGVGGIDIAFSQAGCETVWANENDTDACLTYRRNFPDTPLVEEDIRRVKTDWIPAFDILTAGFPCQPFSSAGEERGFQDARGNLFFEICRVIDAKHPPVVFLENVANLRKHDGGNTFRRILEELESRNYYVKWVVADAKEYGFPQQRNRIYISCFRDHAAAEAFAFPKKQPLTVHVSDLIRRDVRVPDFFYLNPGTKNYERMNQAITDVDQVYRFSDGKFAAKGGILAGKNGICFTLLAGMGNWHDREPVIRDAFGIRKLTPQECFALQGFPKDYILTGTPLKSAYRQAGNTVCVPVVRQFAENIVNALRASSPDEENTLIGTLSSRNQLSVCLDHGFYHFPARKCPERMDAIRYIAIWQSGRFFPGEQGVQYVGEVESYEILPRKNIRELPKQSDEPYCLLRISKWHHLPLMKPDIHGAITLTGPFWKNRSE